MWTLRIHHSVRSLGHVMTKHAAAAQCLHVGLVTCAELPQLDEDTHCLIAPLAAHGVSATRAVWDDSDVDWKPYDLVVVRSCWDYVRRRSAFLNWAQSVTQLANSAPLVAWNTDKRYLRDLETRGVAVVPTTWLSSYDSWAEPTAGTCVIKPAVGMASLDAGRYRMGDSDQRQLALGHVRRFQAAGRLAMVQPYLSRIEKDGEMSLVYLRAVFSHALRKRAVLTGPDEGIDRRFQPRGGPNLELCQPTEEQLATAERVLAAVPGGREALLYARVDLIPDDDGKPFLMEVELTELQLYFGYEHTAADRWPLPFATTLVQRERGDKHYATGKNRGRAGEGL